MNEAQFAGIQEPEGHDEEEEEPGYCPSCSGSGEGQYEGTHCSACKGKGEL